MRFFHFPPVFSAAFFNHPIGQKHRSRTLEKRGKRVARSGCSELIAIIVHRAPVVPEPAGHDHTCHLPNRAGTPFLYHDAPSFGALLLLEGRGEERRTAVATVSVPSPVIEVDGATGRVRVVIVVVPRHRCTTRWEGQGEMEWRHRWGEEGGGGGAASPMGEGEGERCRRWGEALPVR